MKEHTKTKRKSLEVYLDKLKKSKNGGEGSFCVALIGYIFPSVYFTLVCYWLIMSTCTTKTHTCTGLQKKISLVLPIEDPVLPLPRIVGALLLHAFGHHSGFGQRWELDRPWIFMCTTLCAHNTAFAELRGSTAGSLSSSLLCFPGLRLPPFTNQETFFLMRA